MPTARCDESLGGASLTHPCCSLCARCCRIPSTRLSLRCAAPPANSGPTQNETASRPQPISNVEERAGYFRTLAPRPVTFRIAAVGALPSRERLIAMATGHDGAQGGNFFASVVSSDELRVTPAAVGVAAEAAADDAAAATSWNLLHDQTVLPLSSFSLVVQVRLLSLIYYYMYY